MHILDSHQGRICPEHGEPEIAEVRGSWYCVICYKRLLKVMSHDELIAECDKVFGTSNEEEPILLEFWHREGHWQQTYDTIASLKERLVQAGYSTIDIREAK